MGRSMEVWNGFFGLVKRPPLPLGEGLGRGG